MIRRPPRSTLLTHSFPTRRSSDLNEKIPFLVNPRDITCGKPAIRIKHLGRCLGIVPVPLRDQRSANHQFSRRTRLVTYSPICDTNLGLRKWQADRPVAGGPPEIGRASCRERVCQSV